MRHGRLHFLVAPAAGVCAQQFTNDTINMVRSNLATSAMQSWELGTRAQALLELDAPAFSVYTAGSIPPPKNGRGALTDVIGIATNIVNALPQDAAPRPLINDSAAGDPASVGVAVLLVNAITPNSSFDQAAADQLAYLENNVPHTQDGAISHRTDQVQLWSDFVYMAPPFIAYYGALTKNATLLQLAYTQCKLYRQYLRDNSTSLWAHMALSTTYNDEGHWSTGMGWAANGMLRVLATIQNSKMGGFKSQISDLQSWVSEILDATFSRIDNSTLLFTDYADQPTTFSDAASTALITSAVYRLALLRGVHTHLPQAERVRKGLVAHVDQSGWLAPVVNPEDFGSEGSHSPESEAFVLLLHSAWRDWVADGSPGANGAGALQPALLAVLATALCAALALMH